MSTLRNNIIATVTTFYESGGTRAFSSRIDAINAKTRKGGII